MIALGESQALEGVSTHASEVTYTISGCLITSASPPAASTYQVLAQGQLPSSAGSLYNPGASNYALVSSIHLFNTNTVAETVTLYLEGTAAANAIATMSVPAGGFATYEDGCGWQVYTAAGVQVALAGLTTAASYISGTVSVSAATITNIVSLALSAGTWLLFGTGYAKLTTATLGHQDWWLGPTSASKTGAYTAATSSMGNLAGGNEDDTCTLVTVQAFAATTTVYLETYASEATTVQSASLEQTIAQTTGILAVKIA